MLIEVPYFHYADNYKMWKLHNRSLIKEYNIQLKVYDGLPESPWNGGRTPLDNEPPKGIDISFAITNHTVTDYQHSYSHQYLQMFHKKGNSLIISNLDLAKHLKLMYPDYTYIYSITAFDISNGFGYYKLLEPLFDYIVPRSEIFHPDNINEFYALRTKKYMPLYSYECVNCPLYNQHYKFIGENVMDKSKKHLTKCWIKNKELFDETPYNADDYDYEYESSRTFHNKIRSVDPSILGGYKIGRNEQSWESIREELDEIVRLITKNKLK